VGILLLVILRNMVGMKTFGTFMPVLIAISFRQTELLWGILFFGIVVGIGLSVRFYMEQLKLLLVPRLAAVVVVGEAECGAEIPQVIARVVDKLEVGVAAHRRKADQRADQFEAGRCAGLL